MRAPSGFSRRESYARRAPTTRPEASWCALTAFPIDAGTGFSPRSDGWSRARAFSFSRRRSRPLRSADPEQDALRRRARSRSAPSAFRLRCRCVKPPPVFLATHTDPRRPAHPALSRGGRFALGRSSRARPQLPSPPPQLPSTRHSPPFPAAWRHAVARVGSARELEHDAPTPHALADRAAGARIVTRSGRLRLAKAPIFWPL